MQQSVATALNQNQRRIVIVLWLVYVMYYVGRVNISPALASIAESLQISRAEVGVLGTALFWAYALGQLINGELGNHFSPRKIIALGLGTVAVVNVLFSAQTTLLPMVILWAINGFAQSTGWGPILRILSEHLTHEQRARVSMPFALSFQFGTAITWLMSTLLVLWIGWQASFLIPGVIVFIALVLWWSAKVDAPQSTVKPPPFRWSNLLTDVLSAWRVMLVTAVMGVVYTSVNLWLPTYFADTGLFDSGSISVISTAMPIIGAAGMIVAAALLQRISDPMRVLRLFLVGIMLAAGLAALSAGYLQIFFVAFIMFVIGSASSMLTTSIPLTLAREGRTSSTAGTINAIHYLGGGLAGFVVGSLIDSTGWSGVFLLWAVCALVSLIMLAFVKTQSQ